MSKIVLLVDDEADLVTLLKFILGKYGMEVITASNGKEALAYLNGEIGKAVPRIPDIIVTDVMMPEMDGYTMVTRIREEDEFRSIPVIVMTAKGQTRDLFMSVSNVPAFIEKPFEPRTLKNKIDEVLEISKD